jgi:hypothetical protein
VLAASMMPRKFRHSHVFQSAAPEALASGYEVLGSGYAGMTKPGWLRLKAMVSGMTSRSSRLSCSLSGH